jgi:hypothetical protein
MYTIEKLPGKREGWAIYDSAVGGYVGGTRCTTKRECLEAAKDLGITISSKVPTK